MLRAAVACLMLLPTLAPPGFCVCRLESAWRRAPAVASAVSQVCRCRNPACRRRHAPEKPDGSGARAAVPISTHGPNCPAPPAFAVERPRSVEWNVLFAELLWNERPIIDADRRETPTPSAPTEPTAAADSIPIFVLACAYRC